MTEQVLRDCLEEARKEGQIGLFVWANWNVWRDFTFDIKPGNKDYDFALSQINKGEEARINVVWNSLKTPGFIAISIEKLLASDEFFKYVLNTCFKNHYNGPITSIPKCKVCKSYE